MKLANKRNLPVKQTQRVHEIQLALWNSCNISNASIESDTQEVSDIPENIRTFFTEKSIDWNRGLSDIEGFLDILLNSSIVEKSRKEKKMIKKKKKEANKIVSSLK